MTTEEQLLRTALTDAATGQPPAPYDRLDGVRRRHARRQQGRLVALGTAAILAVTGAALGFTGLRIGGGGNTTPAAHRNVPSWALQWPDHRDRSIPQSVLDGAVQYWAQTHPASGSDNVAAPDQAIWYLARHVARDEIAVAFEYSGGGAPYFVMGHASADEVLNPPPPSDAPDASSPWVLHGVPVTQLSAHPVLGLNLGVPNPDTGQDEDIVVLTDPRAARLEFEAVGADGRMSQWKAPMTAGYAEAILGPIRSRVRITAVRDAHGTMLAGGMYVGLPTTEKVSPALDTPVLMEVPPFTDVPDSSTPGFAYGTGQGSIQNQSQEEGPWPMHGTTVYARCYGGRDIVVSIDSTKAGHRVVIPCDDREHVVNGPPVMAHSELAAEAFDDATGNSVTPNTPGDSIHAMAIRASDYTAWRVQVLVR